MNLAGILFFVVLVILLVLLLWSTTKKVDVEEHAEKPPKVEKETVLMPEEASAPDDLAIIEGIGPKIAKLFLDKGYVTFADLADADVAKLEAILEEAGLQHLADPTTWPQQARLAADGDWDALKVLQDELQGGRA
jgi:predicted flap endonuclease-1-like 5' DNA nuclease